jgi:sugar lactone lactonase YvrE
MPRVTVSKATMSKAITAIVNLLVVACVFAFARWFSARLAANSIVSAILVVLALALTVAGMDSRWKRRAARRCLRHAAPGLLVLLVPVLVWATFGTSFQGVVTVLPTGSITLSSAADVIVDSQGNVYIADNGNNQIVEVTPAGVASVLAFPGLSPALHNPQAVALDGAGNLFVADGPNARVVELSGGVASVVNTGSLLSYPDGVVLDASGNLYIADAGNNDIVEVPAGGAAAVLAITGLGTPLNSPGNVAVDVSGNLYIADAGNSRVVVVAPGGVGSVLSISGGVTLSVPLGVAVDNLGNVYIADRNNNRIVTVTSAGVGNVLNTGSTTLHFPQGVAVDIFGTVYINDNNGGSRIVEVAPTTVGFGHLATGAVSGTTLTLPITIGSGVTFGSVQAFTQGTPGLDFTVASTTCVSGTTTDAPCTVNVTFLSTAAGLRRGAVVIYNDATPNLPILTVPIYGTGDAPLAALAPNTGTVVSTGGVTLSGPFNLALDGAGNMYVGDYIGSNVTWIPAGGGAATVVALGTPGSIPADEITGVAVDGAGNLFIGDYFNSRILVVTPGGVVSVLSISGLSPALGHPVALALDAAGNLYIADYTNGQIVRVSGLVVVGSTSSGQGEAIATGTFSFAEDTLTGLTVDAQGNIYAAAQNYSSVVKVTATGEASELSFPGVTPAISDPQGVAVDAMGNVYVVDADTNSSRIVRLTTAGVASVLGIGGLPAPSSLGSEGFGVTLDPSGNLYIPDFINNRIVFVNVSTAVLAFPNTDVGSASSPQAATVANLGDLPLIFATVPNYTVNFSEDGGDENLCALSTSLAAGTLCDVSVAFTPQSAGSLSAGIVVTNNSLNLTATTQSVAVSGTGIAVADATAVAVSTNPTSVVLGQAITITAIVTDTTAGHTGTIPTGGVTFMDTVGSTTVSLNGGSAVTLNGSGMAILAGVTLAGAGTHTITANYVGVGGSFVASSNATTVAVAAAPITPTITWTAPSGAIAYGTSLSGILDASATSGSTMVAGTFAYTATLAGGSPVTVTGATLLGAGSYTLAATFTPTDTTTYASASGTVSLTVATATPAVALMASGNPAVVATTITFTATVSSSAGTPSGSVGFYDGTTLLGSGTLALGVAAYATSGLVVGAHSITAAYGGNSNFSALTSSVLTETVTVPATTTTATTLTASPNPLADGQPATLTATVTPAPTGSPAGIISFYSGTTLLGTGTLDASGVATFTTSSLVVGGDSITAVYPGNAGFAASTSSALSETVNTAYTVTGPTTPVPVAPGGAATFNLTVPPLGGAFDSVVTLSATGLPPGATATFNPPTVTPGSVGAPTILTIQLATLAASGSPVRDIPANRRFPVNRGFPLPPFSLGFVLFGAVLGRKRIPRTLVLVLALASLGVATSLLSGCGGGFSNTPSTPAGNYSITVTGTSGSFQASTTVTLAVE